jgi:hypothetical protein
LRLLHRSAAAGPLASGSGLDQLGGRRDYANARLAVITEERIQREMAH